MKTQFAISKDGVRIAYDITGVGPPLMLIQGAGKTRNDWHKLGYVNRLSKDFTVITVDVRGTGESDYLKDIVDYGIKKICDDLTMLADACKVEHFAIWGYSFGGEHRSVSRRLVRSTHSYCRYRNTPRTSRGPRV